MGSKALAWAWEQKAAGQEGKLVLMLLAEAIPGAGVTGELNPGRVADFAMIEESKVSRVLDSLVQAGRLAGWETIDGRIRYQLPPTAGD